MLNDGYVILVFCRENGELASLFELTYELGRITELVRKCNLAVPQRRI